MNVYKNMIIIIMKKEKSEKKQPLEHKIAVSTNTVVGEQQQDP